MDTVKSKQGKLIKGQIEEGTAIFAYEYVKDGKHYGQKIGLMELTDKNFLTGAMKIMAQGLLEGLQKTYKYYQENE